jgi:transposase-like protein
MAGRTQFSDEDKARLYTALAANDWNVKRTARETGFSISTVRRYRDKFQSEPPSTELVEAAVGEFVDDAEKIRNLALQKLEAKIKEGDISARDLVTTIGVLDDKITRAKGLPTSRTENVSAFPSREELGELLGGFMVGAIQAAEKRHAEIVDAEIVEEAEPLALPSGG